MTEKEELDSWIKGKLEEISRKRRTPYDELQGKFDKVIAEFEGDPQLSDPVNLYRYAYEVVLSRTVVKPPLLEYKLILFGDSGTIVSKKNNRETRNLYGYGNVDGKNTITKLVFRDNEVKMAEDLEMMRVYNCWISPGKQDKRLFFVQKTSKFEPGIPLLPEKQRAIIEKLGIDKMTTATLKGNISSVDEKGNVDSFDLKVIEGMISQKRNGMRSNGTPWCVYELIDSELVMGNPADIGSLSVWVPEPFDAYEEEDRVFCIGTTRLAKEQVSMNTISVIPSIVMHREEEEL
jgi:hypothetical protein